MCFQFNLRRFFFFFIFKRKFYQKLEYFKKLFFFLLYLKINKNLKLLIANKLIFIVTLTFSQMICSSVIPRRELLVKCVCWLKICLGVCFFGYVDCSSVRGLSLPRWCWWWGRRIWWWSLLSVKGSRLCGCMKVKSVIVVRTFWRPHFGRRAMKHGVWVVEEMLGSSHHCVIFVLNLVDLSWKEKNINVKK